MTKFPELGSNQKAPFAKWPPGKIAARSFNDMEITFDFMLEKSRASSPMVEASMLRGDILPTSAELLPTV